MWINNHVENQLHKCAELVPLCDSLCDFDENDGKMISVDLAMIHPIRPRDGDKGCVCTTIEPCNWREGVDIQFYFNGVINWPHIASRLW